MHINQELIQQKIIPSDRLNQWLDSAREPGFKLVFTNGCFDILHRGHIDYLSKAAELGDFLVIGLNSDQSVSRLKGPNRPVQDEWSRAWILASLFFVDAVVLFDENTPYELIGKLQPDVLIKGSDYSIDQIVGADIVTKKGGEVKTLDFLPGYSTTNIINRMVRQ